VFAHGAQSLVRLNNCTFRAGDERRDGVNGQQVYAINGRQVHPSGAVGGDSRKEDSSIVTVVIRDGATVKYT